MNFFGNNDEHIDSLVSQEKFLLAEERKKIVLTDEFFKNEELLLKYYGRNNYINSERAAVTKEYREKCVVFMVDKYGWPKYVAKKAAQTIRLPRHRDHHTIDEYLVGYLAGALPSRYIDPIALATNRDPLFYKKVAIGLDVLITVPILASVYFNKEIGEGLSYMYDVFRNMPLGIVPSGEMNYGEVIDTVSNFISSKTGAISNFYEVFKNMPIGMPPYGTISYGDVIGGVSKGLSMLKIDDAFLLNVQIKFFQAPLRAASLYFFKYHIPSLASIINPIIPEALGASYLNIHNIFKIFEEKKQKKSGTSKKTKRINNTKNFCT